MSDTVVADPGVPAPAPADPAASATPAGGGTPAPQPAPAPSPSPAPAPAPAPAPQPAPSPAPAPAPNPAPGTLAGGSAPDTRLQVTATWPENWRQEIAGGDEKELKRLERMSSPADVFKAYRELEGKVSSGKLKAVAEPLPDNATPEQVTAWRAEQGLPANADAFVTGLSLPNGIVPGQADQPLLASFAEEATAAGWNQQQYNQAVGWYYSLQDQLIGDRQQADADSLNEATVDLMREWGPEFKANQTRITQFFDAHFPKDADDIRAARLPDGRLVGNDPVYNRVFLEIAKIINPAAAVLPNIPGANMSNVGDRIAETETKFMRAPPNTPEYAAYWLGPGGQRMQQEYRELVTARETMRERQGAGR
jgi:hypothetical protein